MGDCQLQVFPMKREVLERRYPVVERKREHLTASGLTIFRKSLGRPAARMDMGLAPGGRRKQETYHDRFELSDRDLSSASRCFIHLANSMVWRAITGENQPVSPEKVVKYHRGGRVREGAFQAPSV